MVHFIQEHLLRDEETWLHGLAWGTFAERPDPEFDGRLFFATDTGIMYRDNATSWETVFVSLPSEITNPQDGQILVYNSEAKKWENKDPIVSIERKGTRYEINVSASGPIGPEVPSGKKLIVYSYVFTVDADMKARLRWGSSGEIVATSRGSIGLVTAFVKEEGPASTRAYIQIVSGTGSVEGTLYGEVVDA